MNNGINYPIRSQSDALNRTDLLVGQKTAVRVELKDIEPAKAGTPEEVGSVQSARVQVKRLLAEGMPLNTMCASLGSLAKLLRRLEDLGPEWGDEAELTVEMPEVSPEAVSLLEPEMQRLYTLADQPPLMESLLRARGQAE